jgi:Zn-dependent protease
LVSLAGPLTNFLLAVLASIPFRLGLVQFNFNAPANSILPTPSLVLSQFIFINLVLMLFNLLPIAPLDGDKIAEYLFPPSWAQVLVKFRPYGSIVLLAIVFVLPMLGIDVLGTILYPVISRILIVLGVI